MPPAVITAITLRMSRVRRAGKMFTSSSVVALPSTDGITRKGTSANAMNGAKPQPPS